MESDLNNIKLKFDNDGFIVNENLINQSDLEAIEKWISELNDSKEVNHHYEKTVNGKVLSRTENFVSSHTSFREFLLSSSIKDYLTMLFDDEPILFKEKINYKYPGGAGYAPHQDAPAYPFGKKHITMLLAIDDSDINNGCLEFARGRNNEGIINIDEKGCIDSLTAEKFVWEKIPLKKGGAVFFDSFVPHRSSTNKSSRPRRALYVTYNAKTEGDLRKDYYDFKKNSLKDGYVSLIGHFEGEAIK